MRKIICRDMWADTADESPTVGGQLGHLKVEEGPQEQNSHEGCTKQIFSTSAQLFG